MVNFRDLVSKRGQTQVIEPRALFQTLAREKQYEYLRDVQGDVLDEWHMRRTEQDLVIKMNTGSGKTLVGLLLLWSKLKEGKGPALYLCPNNHLVSQVRNEADRLGIKHLDFGSDNQFPIEFHESTGILVTTIQKLINGLSVFKIAGRPDPVKVSTILVDDAHACINITREQFTATFPRDSAVGRQLFNLFNTALRQQSVGMYQDVERGVYDAYIRVPYWVWQQKLDEVASLFSEKSESNELKFVWPFLRQGEILPNSMAVVSGDRIEVTPIATPIDLIPSFMNASHRVYMSATLVDDTALIKNFAANAKSVQKPIKPKVGGDIGERLIVTPAIVDSKIEETTTIKLVSEIQAQHQVNVVVLVPSARRGDAWNVPGATKVPGNDISDTIQRLSNSASNTAIIANRYDGIDLPDNACRVLIIDDIPQEHSLINLSEATARQDSPILKRQIAQKIEQGMGRGVRSRTDYCVVILTGRRLVTFMAQIDNQSFFTAETKRQIEMGKTLSAKLKEQSGNTYQAILDLVSQCLDRDPDWQEYHRGEIQDTQPNSLTSPGNTNLASAELQAWRFAINGQYRRAGEEIARLINANTELATVDQGWYMQLQAEYLYHEDQANAMEKQLKAHELNSNLLKPPAGVNYRKIQAKTTLQTESILNWAKNFNDPNALVVKANEILDSLVFGEPHNVFEKSLSDLAAVLGFQSQCPDQDSRQGPDVLWCMENSHYIIIEAKNQVKPDRAKIFKAEAEQINHHITWFKQNYPKDQYTPVLIHPAAILAPDAYLESGTKIIQKDDLQRFLTVVRNFVAALAGKSSDLWSVQEIANQLKAHQLSPSDIVIKHFKREPYK